MSNLKEFVSKLTKEQKDALKQELETPTTETKPQGDNITIPVKDWEKLYIKVDALLAKNSKENENKENDNKEKVDTKGIDYDKLVSTMFDNQNFNDKMNKELKEKTSEANNDIQIGKTITSLVGGGNKK